LRESQANLGWGQWLDIPKNQRYRWENATTYLSVPMVLLRESQTNSAWVNNRIFMCRAIKDRGRTTSLLPSPLTLRPSWSSDSSVSFRSCWKNCKQSKVTMSPMKGCVHAFARNPSNTVKDKGGTTSLLLGWPTLRSSGASVTIVSFRSCWVNCNKQSRDELNDRTCTRIRSKSKQLTLKTERLHYVTVDLPCGPTFPVAPVSPFGPIGRIVSKVVMSSMTGNIHAFPRNPGKLRHERTDFTTSQSTYLAVHRLQCLLSVLLREL
jgi:hypothetical protein